MVLSGPGETSEQSFMENDREIRREELHDLVWSKATNKAAKEFDLSSVGLA
jgi:hypothetical protein